MILDEGDQLDSSKMLYGLHTIRPLSLIFIANREVDLLQGLEERVTSRIQIGRRTQFDHYTDDQLVDILEKRVAHGFHSSAVSPDVLTEIATAAESDARTAISILRVAAQEAMIDGLENIIVEHVEDAVPQAQEEVRQKDLSKLTTHQRVLSKVLEEHGPMNQSELYEYYEEAHPDPITLRALRKSHLPKLQHYNMLSEERVGRGKQYRVIDPTTAYRG